MNLVLVQTTPFVQPENPAPPTAKASHRTHPSVQTKHPPNLVLDEDYAWKMFKGFITDKEMSAYYDMSVRDFERSTIHDLFKVCSFFIIPILFSKKFWKISNSPSSIYTTSSQAKELCDEAKATKAKSKELNNEVLLKKGEVIRLTKKLTLL